MKNLKQNPRTMICYGKKNIINQLFHTLKRCLIKKKGYEILCCSQGIIEDLKKQGMVN